MSGLINEQAWNSIKAMEVRRGNYKLRVSRRETRKSLRKSMTDSKTEANKMNFRKIERTFTKKQLRKMSLQLFTDPTPNPDPEPKTEPTPDPGPKPGEKKYTDDDLNRIIDQKFAEWQKKQEKKVTEAEKLGNMTAEEKAEKRMKELEARIQKYERESTRTEMMNQARAILQDDDINVSDRLLESLVKDDAESTKSAVEEFASLFRAEVGKAVKEALKGDEPKSGGASKLTKEQILAVKDRTERQRLIRENMSLFK